MRGESGFRGFDGVSGLGYDVIGLEGLVGFFGEEGDLGILGEDGRDGILGERGL